MDKPGHVNGRHFSSYAEKVKELKRDGNYEAAIKLLNVLISATESETAANKGTVDVAPWYYDQLAIIYRKTKNPAGEKTILQRFIATTNSYPSIREKYKSRLSKIST